MFRYTFVMAAVLWSLGIAASLPDVYYAEIPVTSKQSSLLSQSLQQGLSELLLRVTGSMAILERSETQQILRQPLSFVQQYQYLEASDKLPLRLGIHFDEQAVTDFVRAQGFAVWDHQRPVTIMWLAVQWPDGRSVMSATHEHVEMIRLKQLFEQHALSLGIPLIFPLMDLEDTQRISTSDVWGQFSGLVGRASQRYRADAVLIGRLFPDGQSWTAQWSLQSQERQFSWHSRSATYEELVLTSVVRLSEHLASLYVTDGEQPQPVSLRISNVDSSHAYARALQELSDIRAVQEIHVKQVGSGELVIQCQVDGGIEVLERVLDLRPGWQQVDEHHDQESKDAHRWYRLHSE